MPALPILSGRDIVRAFGEDGWQMVRHSASVSKCVSMWGTK